jgi:hypothetical protein
MFLVSHSHEHRAREIRSWLPRQPSVALVIAAVYFEWTLCRAIIGLSKRPNKELRADLVTKYGLGAYKDFWRDELTHLSTALPLSRVVKDWHAVTKAFEARNLLVHGRDRYTPNMAEPHVDCLLNAVSDVCAYCSAHGLNVNRRLPQRRAKNA